MNRTFVALVTLSLLGISSMVGAQIACFQYGNTLSCDSSRGNTSITEFSRGAGVITQQDRNGSSLEPYTIIGRDRDDRRNSYRFDPNPLPTLQEHDPYRSSTYEERQAIRDSGRIPEW